jgi:hypothetical protein
VIYGTEISDVCQYVEGVLQMDFHRPLPRWIGEVDFIYSNSLDHSYDPQFCIGQWMKSLVDNGICFIEWTKYHSEAFMGDADCFGATLEEYTALCAPYHTRTKALESGVHIMLVSRQEIDI